MISPRFRMARRLRRPVQPPLRKRSEERRGGRAWGSRWALDHSRIPHALEGAAAIFYPLKAFPAHGEGGAKRRMRSPRSGSSARLLTEGVVPLPRRRVGTDRRIVLARPHRRRGRRPWRPVKPPLRKGRWHPACYSPPDDGGVVDSACFHCAFEGAAVITCPLKAFPPHGEGGAKRRMRSPRSGSSARLLTEGVVPLPRRRVGSDPQPTPPR